MTAAAAVLAQAVRSGLVSASAALSGAVTVTRIEGSNPVLRLAHDGRVLAFVKGTGPAARLNGEDTVARERAVMARLSAFAGAPAELATGTADDLWLAPVAGRPLASLVGDIAVLSEAFAALGRTLADLHRVPVSPGAPVMGLPWPMLETTPSHMETARYHEVPTRVIATARDLSDVAAGARRAWRPEGWAHGDVSASNVLVDAEGAHLVDWESAGLGNRSWDLAGARVLAEQAAPEWSELAMRRLLSAYREAGGAAPEPDPALWCVRLLVAAYQLAVGVLVGGGTPDADGSVSALLERAREAGERWRERAHG